MYKSILTIIVLMLMQSISFGQTEEATTRSGKKVILYADGTWKYADDTKQEIKKNEEKKKEPEKRVEPESSVLPGECAAAFEAIEDQRTGIRTTRTKNLIIIAEANGKKEISVSLQKGAKLVIKMTLRATGAGECVGEGNKINLIFTDNSKLDMANDGLSNCRGESSVNFGGPYGRKKMLEELKTKKIKSIKVWTQQGSVQLNLSVENQEEILRMINCLSTQ